MSVVTQDTVLKKGKSRRGRRKGASALRKIKRALARKKLEEMRHDFGLVRATLDEAEAIDTADPASEQLGLFS